MVNLVDLNTITLADIIHGFSNAISNAVDNYMSTKLPSLGNTGVEKPLTTEEAAAFLNISVPVLRDLAESGAIPRHKWKGVRGYHYFASELVHALKSQKQLN
ncbi:helix-turn-helix domain-containing protein [Pontibacter litorisediminis]|uniref:helix-turn-helix domain-containing protein n=1 Tax=Pontibacter litorisediminis TaxID=1846260 RepID=UPI0023EAAB23|nr:helix-turn-helix domain-containing protein [Pontibacter litorisediminis]